MPNPYFDSGPTGPSLSPRLRLPEPTAITVRGSRVDGEGARARNSEELVDADRRPAVQYLLAAAAAGPDPEGAAIPDAQDLLREGLESLLMQRFRDTGEREAFEHLYRLTAPNLETWIAARSASLGGRADAQEVLQDTFVNIYRYGKSFKGTGPNGFRRWARTIAANALHRSCRGRAIVFAEWTDGIYEVASTASDPQRLAEHREWGAEVDRAWTLVLHWVPLALQTLSARDRYVLTAVEIQGASYREIETELGLRVGGLKMIMHRARSRFHKALESLANGIHAKSE